MSFDQKRLHFTSYTFVMGFGITFFFSRFRQWLLLFRFFFWHVCVIHAECKQYMGRDKEGGNTAQAHHIHTFYSFVQIEVIFNGIEIILSKSYSFLIANVSALLQLVGVLAFTSNVVSCYVLNHINFAFCHSHKIRGDEKRYDTLGH